MRRVALAMGIVLAAATSSPGARAQEAPPPAVSAAPAAPAAPALRAAPYGVAVVALGGAADSAWPLAQLVYATPSLRPPALDEMHARVLGGEAPAAGAPPEVRDLAESLAAVKGEDAPSRMLLGEIARRLNVRALAVVRVDAGHATARVFLADSGTFDAASYAPDAGSELAWTATARSLSRTFGGDASSGTVAPPASAPALATHEEAVAPAAPSKGRAFYQSGWFWGALGAAAFAGGTIFFATRDNGDSTIHLQAQVPH
jgi:hypothetical protein